MCLSRGVHQCMHWYEPITELLRTCVFLVRCASVLVCYFFFFQAEDGIRDYKVTGVQTCALPISRQPGTARPLYERGRFSRAAEYWCGLLDNSYVLGRQSVKAVNVFIDFALDFGEIGRASCRERV